MTQSILTVPWVVMEDLEPVTTLIAECDPVTICAQTAEPAASVETPEPVATVTHGRGFWLVVALTGVWAVVAVLLLLAGALLPVEGNPVTFMVMMAGCFLVAGVLLTCPRDAEEPETYWTLGSEPGGYAVGQCTPSREGTLTGRR